MKVFQKLFIFFALCTCAFPAKADPVRLQRLTDLWMEFHEGFAYMEHCYSHDKNAPAATPFFQPEAGAVRKELEKEMKIEHPEADSFQAVNKLGNDKKNTLDQFYQTPDACNTPQAIAAKKMIDDSNDLSLEQFAELQKTPEKVIELLEKFKNEPAPVGSRFSDQMKYPRQ